MHGTVPDRTEARPDRSRKLYVPHRGNAFPETACSTAVGPPNSGSGGGGRTSATIRRLAESDLCAYRTLRLSALSTDPLAFGSTRALESSYDDARWTERVSRAAGSASESVWVAEGKGGRLVGMIGAFTKEEAFHVFGMWVDPGHRRSGIGGRLLDGLLQWTVTANPQAAVLLSVNPSQVAAVRLYLTYGFRPTGVVEPLGHTPGAIVHQMRWSGDRLSAAPGK